MFPTPMLSSRKFARRNHFSTLESLPRGPPGEGSCQCAARIMFWSALSKWQLNRVVWWSTKTSQTVCVWLETDILLRLRHLLAATLFDSGADILKKPITVLTVVCFWPPSARQNLYNLSPLERNQLGNWVRLFIQSRRLRNRDYQ